MLLVLVEKSRGNSRIGWLMGGEGGCLEMDGL